MAHVSSLRNRLSAASPGAAFLLAVVRESKQVSGAKGDGEKMRIPIVSFEIRNEVRDELLAACRAQRDEAPHLFDPLINAISSGALALELGTETWELPAFQVALFQAAALAHHFAERTKDAVSAGSPAESLFLASGIFVIIGAEMYRAGAERWSKAVLS